MPVSRRSSLAAVAVVGAVACSVLAAAPAFATVTTLYVGGAGCSDLGSGTQTQPYCTINKGAGVATSGQTVLVAAGTYAEKATVAHSGMLGAPVTIQAVPGASVIVTGASNGFVVSGKSYVTISGFTVTATTSYGISISSSTNIVISGNTVTYSGHPVSGQLAAGIYLSNTTASTVTGNTADHNSNHGIYLTTGSSGNTISHNEASWNANVYQRNANGIDVIAPANSIVGNVLHDNEDSGLQFYTGGDNNLATLNVSYNNGDHGIDDYNVTGGRLIGNTIYHNCTSGINVEGLSGSYLVENNIAVDNAVYPAYQGIACSRRAGNIGIWDSAPATTTVDDNLVFLSTSGTMYVFGTPYTSLAAMKSATGQEQHGQQANPNFAGAGTGDLRLTQGSPAIDAADSGASGEQAADIAGVARQDDVSVTDTGIGPRSYDDRGAYEFTSDGAMQPPVAVLTVTPDSGTAPVAVTADASGSHDPQGQAITYTFNFGDGTTVGPQSGATASHTYTAAGSYTVTVTVTDTANLTGTAQHAVTVQAAGGNPAFVNQIATNYSTSAHTSGSVTVWRTEGVAAGDLEVVTLQLTGTAASGAVTGSDDGGTSLAVARDIADATGDRFLVLSGVAHAALVPGSKITVTFPTAASYRMTADEISGVTAVDRTAAAAGTGTTYASGATAVTSSPKEFVFGAVAVFAGTAPAWATGWTAEQNYAIGANYVGRAYQVTTSSGSFNAAGTASGGWLAICVTFQ
jgi:parallel beta-helix repeat protein